MFDTSAFDHSNITFPGDTHKVVEQTYLTRNELEVVDPYLARTDRVSVNHYGFYYESEKITKII